MIERQIAEEGYETIVEWKNKLWRIKVHQILF